MVARWSDCRDAARRGQLSHADLVQLLEAQAAVNHWARINRWLPLLLERGVGLGERKGSLIAIASWLLRQRRAELANTLLTQLNSNFFKTEDRAPYAWQCSRSWTLLTTRGLRHRWMS